MTIAQCQWDAHLTVVGAVEFDVTYFGNAGSVDCVAHEDSGASVLLIVVTVSAFAAAAGKQLLGLQNNKKTCEIIIQLNLKYYI